MNHNYSVSLPPTALHNLPNDILLIIIDQLDQASILQLARVAKFISNTSLHKLWHTPKCNTPLALKLIISTTSKSNTMFPYHNWMIGLDISLSAMQSLSDNMFNNAQLIIPQQAFNLKTLRLANVQATVTTSQFLINYFLSSTNHIEEIQIINCSTEIISSVITIIATEKAKYQELSRIAIQGCFITDTYIQQIVISTPQLRYFSIEQSGYMISDAAIFAITEHCPLIETLIVTLPSHLVQSNTITFTSIQSLSACIYLKSFVCRGQIRIANQECKDWLYNHCPKLEHCDVSF